MMKFTYCPNCKSDLHQEGERLLICDTCGFQYYLSPSPSVSLILENDQEEVLLVKQGRGFRKGFWDVPGGFIEFNESGEQAVVRETKEETNIDIKNFKYFGSYPGYYLYKDFTYHPLSLCYIGKINSEQSKQIKPADDVIDFKFYKKKEIPWDQIAYVDVKQALKDYVTQSSSS